MHNTRSDITAIISVALGQIPYKDLAPLLDRNYDTRAVLRAELGEYLERQLLLHFELQRRPMIFNGHSNSGRHTGWRGAL